MAFPRIVSRDEIEGLKQEIGGRDELQVSIENLNKSVIELVQLFKAAIVELKYNPQDELSKKMDLLISKIEESNQLNRQLIELQKDKNRAPRQFQKPVQQFGAQPAPQQPRFIPQFNPEPPKPFQDMDLPPLDEPLKPKKRIFGFGK